MVKKYVIHVNPQQQQTQTVQAPTQQIVQQIAQNAANNQLQAQAQEKAEAVDPMRQTVNDLLKNKLLQEIEMPKYTTIQDILNAPKGNKLETFGKYLSNNPDITRLVGTIAGGTYMDRNGNFINAGEQAARSQETQMEADRQKVLAQMKEQNDIATALNNSYMQQDIANERNKLQRELAEQEMQLKREEMEARRQEKAADRAQQMQMLNMRLNGLGGGTATGGAAGLTDKQLKNLVVIDGKRYYMPGATSADKGKIRDNNAIIASLDEGLKVIKNNPKAFGLKGAAPAVIQSELGSKAGNKARSQIGGLAKEYKKYLTGVASNKTEEKDFLRYVPAPFDTADTLEAKIEAIRNISKSKNKGILNTYYFEELDNLGGADNYNDGWAF